MKMKDNDFAKGYDPLDEIINSREDKCEKPTDEYVAEYSKYVELREIQMYQDYIEEPLRSANFIGYLQDNFNESSCLKFKIWLADDFLSLTIDEHEANTVYPSWDDKMTKLIMDKARLYCSLEYTSRRHGGSNEVHNRTWKELHTLAEETFHIEYYLNHLEGNFERYDEE